MFCCGVCNIMFTGIYPEVVTTTLCGHLFHSDCILHCLKNSHRCPYCSLHAEAKHLIKLHFQIDANWKDTAAALKIKANASVVDLDDTMNISIKDLNISNVDITSPIVINLDDSVVAVTPKLPVLDSEHKSKQNLDNCNVKTLLTTSLSAVSLSQTVNDLLSILNDVIPNSFRHMRLLISEHSLIQTALAQGYHRLIIVNMQFGQPIGLTVYNLSVFHRAYVTLINYNIEPHSKNSESVVDKIKTPRLVMKFSNVNECHEWVLDFFTDIFSKYSDDKGDTINAVNTSYCHNSRTVKLDNNFVSLSFYMGATDNA